MSVPANQVQQARTVALPKRFPLVAQMGFRSPTFRLSDPTVLSPVSDAALFNAYAELDPEDKQYWVGKRPGTFTLETGQGSAPGGTGVVYAGTAVYPIYIFGGTLRELSSGSPVVLPYLGTTGHPIVQGRAANFISIPPANSAGGPGVAAWCANGYLWIASVGVSGGHYTAGYLAAQDFISGGAPWASGSTPALLCDGVAYLDEVMYVMDTNGNIWGSNANDFSTWVATTVLSAGGRYDQPVALAQQLEYVIALKSTSLRCFYDSGASAQTDGVGSNLQWVEGADSNFGCANAGSVQLIDETLLWLTCNDKATPQIARMDQLKVSIVSTPQVERLLQQINMEMVSAPYLTTNVVYSAGIKRGGHRWYVLTVPAAATHNGVAFTLAYDLDQLIWCPWSSPGATSWSVTGVSFQLSGTLGSTPYSGLLCQDISSGSLYVLDIDQVYPTDSGTPCQVDIYTPNADLGTRRRKQLNAMYFVNDQVSGSVLQVRKTDDDYRSWSPFRQVSLGVKQPLLTRCGTFRRRALNLRHQAATPLRIKAGDMQLDLGTL